LVREVRAGVCPPAASAAVRLGDKWYLDEVFIKFSGELTYLVQDDNILDILGTNRRDTIAVRRFYRKCLTGTRSVPRVVVTGELRSYGARPTTLTPSTPDSPSATTPPSTSRVADLELIKRKLGGRARIRLLRKRTNLVASPPQHRRRREQRCPLGD
jgi:transposase-like protein